MTVLVLSAFPEGDGLVRRAFQGREHLWTRPLASLSGRTSESRARVKEIETRLQRAARHFAGAKARLRRQKALVAELEKDGQAQAAAIGRDMQNFLVEALEHLEQERRCKR